MAITWGATSGHLQVGIDCWHSSPTNWPAVFVYLRVYVRVPDSWYFDDDQICSVSGPGGGSVSFHNGLNAGQSMLVYSKDLVGDIFYDHQDTMSWSVSITGMYNGGNPKHGRSLTLPLRPPIPPDTPNTPTASNITATGAKLSWNTPVENGRPLDRYAGQIARDSGFTNLVTTWDVAGWATSRSVTGLPKATTLYARVRAHNAAGWSGWSGTRTFTTSTTPPSAPGTPVVSNVKVTTATVSWSTPSDNGGASITGYDVQYATNSSFTAGVVTFSDSASPASLSGLLPGTTYWVRVRAKNSAGAGAWSSATKFTTLSGVWVGDGSQWRAAIVWIGNGTSWVMAQVKVGNGTTWK